MTTEWEPNAAASHEDRVRQMCQLRGEGMSLQAIAELFGVTRERVRQIIRDAEGPSREQAAQARKDDRVTQRRLLRDRALQICRDRPGIGVEALASELGVSTPRLRRALGSDAGRLLVEVRRGKPVFSDETLLDHLRQAASLAGEPLTVRKYNEVNVTFGGASSPLVLQRFGSWSAACEAAGVAYGQPVRQNYRRRWTRAQLVEAVAAYLSSPQSRGSFADYEAWARTRDDAPSGQTIRTQFGPWSSVKVSALSLLAASGPTSDDAGSGGDGQGRRGDGHGQPLRPVGGRAAAS